MPTLTMRPSGKTVTVAEGMTLLEAILSAGETIPHKCKGKAQCGSCHIFAHDGRKGLSKIQRLENEKLDTLIGIGSKSRLACQARIGAEDITVELLSFESGL